MIVGIMQPYFLPYVGYYSLIKYADKWIVFDTPQFIRHGWIERNRILKPNEGWQYIQVPLNKHSQNTAIKDISINNVTDWQSKIIAQLQHYRKRAPYFNDVIDVLKEGFSTDTRSIVNIDIAMLKATCSYLNIPFNYNVFSDMNLKLPEVTAPDEWALYISQAINANEYVNPPGGESFFNKEKYDNGNVKLTFLKNHISYYNQRRSIFEAGLSIVDLMMFNSVIEINSLIDNYELS